MHLTVRKLAFILLALPHGVQSYSAPPVDIYFRRKGHASESPAMTCGHS